MSSTKNRKASTEDPLVSETVPEDDVRSRVERHKRIIDSELKRRALWFVKLRWIVPPIIIFGALAAGQLGLEFNIVAVIGLGLFTLVYNTVCHLFGDKILRLSNGTDWVYLFSYFQVGLDYASVFFLVYLTGGVMSPMIFFFFFHIIFAAILLPARSAFGFAGIASLGMVLMVVAERGGVIANNPLTYNGDAFIFTDKPWYLTIMLLFFIASIFISALTTSLIMGMLRLHMLENVAVYEKEKRQARERWRFMRKAAHNLRAPLAAVMSMLEVLKEDYLGPLTLSQREHLRRIYRRTSTMATMIEKLMTIAKSRTGDRPAFPTPMKLIEMAGRITRTFEDAARQKKIEFNVDVPHQTSDDIADLEVVEPVLENLISNAIKYTMSGAVSVSFRSTDRFLQLTVADTGIGIPESDKGSVFNEFFRAKNAKSLEEMGTGLGLALVKETISQKGGRIEWESEEGRGTRFDVFLPTFVPEQTPADR